MRILAALFLCISLFAQAPPTQASPEHVAAMKKFDFLLGEWRGESWTLVGKEKRTTTGTEIVQSKLNGLVVTVDGTFKDARGQTVHSAFGVFSFNPRSDLYRFQAHTAAGQMADAKVSMRDQGFDWSFEASPGVQVKYEVRLDEKGEWVEKGEMTREGTKVQFFEMRMRKVK